MTLQRSSITGKLLRDPINNNLQEDCWCGTGYRYFEYCCLPSLDDPVFPRYLVISEAKYVALGSPTCVYFHSCQYCDTTGGNNIIACTTNVVEADVTASPYTSCSDSWPKTGCTLCIGCGDCTAEQTPSYVNITIISPLVNGTYEASFTGVDAFGYCVYEYSSGGNTVTLNYYSGIPNPNWIIDADIGGCSFLSNFVFMSEDDRCNFSDNDSIVSGTPAECWASNPGDICRFIITPP